MAKAMNKQQTKASDIQLSLAREFHIPKDQAHTINVEKAQQYKQYLSSERGKVYRLLNQLEDEHGGL
jgi:hypothetical protein